tara:strand:+ start:2173 stop:2532 length:360 start_codon:yes stop_codon:yes gene_type:complete
MSDGFLNSQTLPLIDSQETNWCQLLWVAVLERAVHDAFYQNDYKEAREALEWLDKDNEDFQLVCHLAGKDADYIIRRLYVKIQLRKNFFNSIKEGTNFFLAQKKFEEEMRWNPNLPKRK